LCGFPFGVFIPLFLLDPSTSSKVHLYYSYFDELESNYFESALAKQHKNEGLKVGCSESAVIRRYEGRGIFQQLSGLLTQWALLKGYKYFLQVSMSDATIHYGTKMKNKELATLEFDDFEYKGQFPLKGTRNPTGCVLHLADLRSHLKMWKSGL